MLDTILLGLGFITFGLITLYVDYIIYKFINL